MRFMKMQYVNYQHFIIKIKPKAMYTNHLIRVTTPLPAVFKITQNKLIYICYYSVLFVFFINQRDILCFALKIS